MSITGPRDGPGDTSGHERRGRARQEPARARAPLTNEREAKQRNRKTGGLHPDARSEAAQEGSVNEPTAIASSLEDQHLCDKCDGESRQVAHGAQPRQPEERAHGEERSGPQRSAPSLRRLAFRCAGIQTR